MCRFAVERFAGEACIAGLLRSVPLFDLRDAGTLALAGEAAVSLKLVYERCGEQLLSHLCTAVLPASGLPQVRWALGTGGGFVFSLAVIAHKPSAAVPSSEIGPCVSLVLIFLSHLSSCRL
jgi:hypothetical protein